MSATVTELRESSDKDETELVKCANESNRAGNRHKVQYGQSAQRTDILNTKQRLFFMCG